MSNENRDQELLNGIYYLDTTAKLGIAFFNVTTHRTARVFELENHPAREAP